MFCCRPTRTPGPPTPTSHALVTGACSGIGLSLAAGLAAAGWPLLLVSNDGARLAESAAALSSAHGVAVRTVTLDLSAPDAARALIAALAALPGPPAEVDVLVSNAGFLLFGEAVDAEPARAQALLQLHVVATSMLCSHFGRAMKARRRGWILITSSISAYLAAPGIALYGASKAYQRAFAASIRCELRVWGVGVTLLAPGATATALYNPFERVDVAMGRRWGVMMSPEEVARQGLAALFEGRAVVVPGALSKLMCCCMALTPQWALDCARGCVPWLPRPGK
jgi:short-subunit dehydrogenase